MSLEPRLFSVLPSLPRARESDFVDELLCFPVALWMDRLRLSNQARLRDLEIWSNPARKREKEESMAGERASTPR